MKWWLILLVIGINTKTSGLTFDLITRWEDILVKPVDHHSLSESEHKWTFIIIYDNYIYNSDLKPDWGWSCLIKQDTLNILVDLGGNGEILISNLNSYQLTPESIDLVIITHAHYDHYGGLSHFAASPVPVQYYVPFNFNPELFRNLVDQSSQINYLRNFTVITDQVYSTGVLGDEIMEQSVIVNTDSGLVLITGCSHPGLMNIVEKVNDLFDEKIFLVMGGFHLRGQSDEQITNIARALDSSGVVYIAPAHCSGDRTRELFADYFKDRFLKVGVGFELTI